jgi:hypothetical protein
VNQRSIPARDNTSSRQTSIDWSFASQLSLSVERSHSSRLSAESNCVIAMYSSRPSVGRRIVVPWFPVKREEVWEMPASHSSYWTSKPARTSRAKIVVTGTSVIS